jgi:hypothetical protein
MLSMQQQQQGTAKGDGSVKDNTTKTHKSHKML